MYVISQSHEHKAMPLCFYVHFQSLDGALFNTKTLPVRPSETKVQNICRLERREQSLASAKRERSEIPLSFNVLQHTATIRASAFKMYVSLLQTKALAKHSLCVHVYACVSFIKI